MAEVAKEFEEAAGISLQNLEDRQIWLVEGYLITIVECKLTNAPPKVSPEESASNLLKTLLIYAGLALILIWFAFVFAGTLVLMSTHR